MESSETKDQLSNTPKEKTEETTLYDKKYNWLKNRRWFVYPALIVLVLGIFGAGYTYFAQGVKGVENMAGNLGSYFDMTKTTKSKVKKDPDGKVLISKIEEMYEDITYDRFKAANYFAPMVDRYILVNNLTRGQVDSLYRKNTKDFVSPNAEIQDTAFCLKKEAGKKTLEFWIHMNVFRNSKAKYETCDVKVQFVFNDQNQILVYNELKMKNLKYSAEKG